MSGYMALKEVQKFVPGDRVTGRDPGAKRWGEQGSIVSVEQELSYWLYFVRWDNGDHKQHHRSDLCPVL